MIKKPNITVTALILGVLLQSNKINLTRHIKINLNENSANMSNSPF